MASNKDNYLGIDLGSSSIKIAELVNFKGRPRLATYGFTEKSPANISESGLISDIDEAASIISDICKKAKVSSNKAIAALPNFSVFSSIITLPLMSDKELASAVQWEAKKIMPMPLEDVILNWNKIEEINISPEAPKDNLEASPERQIDVSQEANPFKKIFSKPQKNVKILLTGANKALIKKYVEIFKKANINLLSLETESFALIRSLVGGDLSTVMVIDMGASTSSITIVNKGVPVITRSLELGGLSITRAISNSLNINLERAEQFKQDLSLDAETSENSLPQTVEKSFAPILNEIRYMMNLYNESHQDKVEKIILTGGTAMLGHLSGYLSSVFNVNCYVGDPWAKTIYPLDLKPVLSRIGSRFSVAIGLAMKEIR
ncbi:MAG: Cell division protein FtsA [Parcubacteria group bacterium ADurb.Bin326]|nr:MAG: Cell division protein FtsA [Parcubacteria group bacterium ADurb.Bin326]